MILNDLLKPHEYRTVLWRRFRSVESIRMMLAGIMGMSIIAFIIIVIKIGQGSSPVTDKAGLFAKYKKVEKWLKEFTTSKVYNFFTIPKKQKVVESLEQI